MRRYLTFAALVSAITLTLTLFSSVTPASAGIIGSVCRNFYSNVNSHQARACVSIEYSSTNTQTTRARAWIGKYSTSSTGTINEGCVNHLNLFIQSTGTVRHIDFVCNSPSNGRVYFYTNWYNNKNIYERSGVYNICLYYTDGSYACTATSSWFYSDWVWIS